MPRLHHTPACQSPLPQHEGCTLPKLGISSEILPGNKEKPSQSWRTAEPAVAEALDAKALPLLGAGAAPLCPQGSGSGPLAGMGPAEGIWETFRPGARPGTRHQLPLRAAPGQREGRRALGECLKAVSTKETGGGERKRAPGSTAAASSAAPQSPLLTHLQQSHGAKISRGCSHPNLCLDPKLYRVCT